MNDRPMKDLLRAGPGVNFDAIETSGTPGFVGDKTEGEKALADGAAQLADLQEQLFAASRTGGSTKSVLLVLQAMDTAGKGGIVKHV
ncbi:MAG: polyphosphate kinase 2 family protein, partial [Pseudolysinimonas sp.]